MSAIQWLNKSKFVKVFLVALVLVFSFQVSRPQAVIGPAVKIVAGSAAQKVVRSIGEKAGMKFTQKSLQSTTDYINAQAAKGNVHYIDFATKANQVATTGTAGTKPGWKKYLLDPVMWLTGADLLVEAYDAFNDAKNGGTNVDYYGPADNGGFKAQLPTVANGCMGKVYHDSSPTVVKWESGIYDCSSYDYHMFKAYNITVSGTALHVRLQFYAKDDDDTDWSPTAGTTTYIEVGTPDTYMRDDIRSRPYSSGDEPDITNNTNYTTYKNTIDNDDYSRVTYDNDVVIEAPDTDTVENNDYSDPWNTKMSDEEFNIIVKPIQDVDIVIPPDDDDDLPTGPRPDPVETLDRSLLDVLVKSYDYLDDSIDAAILSMRRVADGAAGIGSFLDDYMGWLPSELRSTIVALMIVGVFAHFFRR